MTAAHDGRLSPLVRLHSRRGRCEAGMRCRRFGFRARCPKVAVTTPMTAASHGSTSCSSTVANRFKDLLACRCADGGQVVSRCARPSPMSLRCETFGHGANGERSQSNRQADTVRCGHAASTLHDDLVRRAHLFSQLLLWFFRRACSPRQM